MSQPVKLHSQFISERMVSLKELLLRMKILPNGPLYQSVNKNLAELSLESGLEQDAIYHLVESQAVSLRQRTVEQIDRLSLNVPTRLLGAAPPGDSSAAMLDKKLLTLTGFTELLERLHDLPPEWTVVQLTAGHNARQFLGNPGQTRAPPSLHITRLDLCCGQPYTVAVALPDASTHSFLENFQGELDFLRQQTIGALQRESVVKYRRSKMATSSRMQTAMSQIETSWLQFWRCILIGQLVDEKLKNRLRAELEKIVCAIKKWKNCSAEVGRHLLYQAILASCHFTCFEVKKLVAHLTGLHLRSAECRKIAESIYSVGNAYPEIQSAKRHPVILIVDDMLQRLPWESISVLNGSPVSRIHSLHFLHALYKVYEHRIRGGFLVDVDPDKGYYIVNPDQNLQQMEQRIRTAFTTSSRFPRWQGTFGVKPTPEQFGRALQQTEIFVYCGHGSGTQFLGCRQLQKLRVNAVSLLFGCNSTGLTSFGARVEAWSTTQCYTMACSPCVVATLWNVTDVEIDKVSIGLLHHWLPPTPQMTKVIERNHKQPLQTSGNRAVGADFDVVSNTTASWQQEPLLQNALRRGSAATQLFLTSAAVISIGLPVCLK